MDAMVMNVTHTFGQSIQCKVASRIMNGPAASKVEEAVNKAKESAKGKTLNQKGDCTVAVVGPPPEDDKVANAKGIVCHFLVLANAQSVGLQANNYGSATTSRVVDYMQKQIRLVYEVLKRHDIAEVTIPPPIINYTMMDPDTKK